MKKTVYQKIMAFVLVFVMILGIGVRTEAAELPEQEGYIIINGNTKIPMYQNYYNQDTGEYFLWNITADSKGSVAKSFSFKIHYSVTSSDFTFNSSKVKVVASAHIEDYTGTWSTGNNNGHKYTVEIFRGLFTSKSLQFAIGGTESGTISGLSSGKSYKVRIINNDAVSSTNYLVGSGTITNN